jgi:CheY-like chemotaxis protein
MMPLDILCVDPERGMRRLLTAGLGSYGYRVFTASNGHCVYGPRAVIALLEMVFLFHLPLPGTGALKPHFMAARSDMSK